MKKQIRLAGIAYETLVNGPGLRRVFFSQGCIHNCEGCFNPETHDFNSGKEFNMDDLIKDVLDNPMLTGVTFSGGDPFERAEEFSYLGKAFEKANLSVWCYTGYTYEFIIKDKNKRKGWKDLIDNIDVLVDGKFDKDKVKDGLKFRGSLNQRIIDVKKSRESNEVVLIEL